MGSVLPVSDGEDGRMLRNEQGDGSWQSLHVPRVHNTGGISLVMLDHLTGGERGAEAVGSIIA